MFFPFFYSKKQRHSKVPILEWTKYFMPSPRGLGNSPLKDANSDGFEVDIRLSRWTCVKNFEQIYVMRHKRSALVGEKANYQMDIRIL